MVEEIVQKAKCMFQRASQALDIGEYEVAVCLLEKRAKYIEQIFSKGINIPPEEAETLVADTLILRNQIQASTEAVEHDLRSYLTMVTARKAYELSKVSSKHK